MWPRRQEPPPKKQIWLAEYFWREKLDDDGIDNEKLAWLDHDIEQLQQKILAPEGEVSKLSVFKEKVP